MLNDSLTKLLQSATDSGWPEFTHIIAERDGRLQCVAWSSDDGTHCLLVGAYGHTVGNDSETEIGAPFLVWKDGDESPLPRATIPEALDELNRLRRTFAPGEIPILDLITEREERINTALSPALDLIPNLLH